MGQLLDFSPPALAANPENRLVYVYSPRNPMTQFSGQAQPQFLVSTPHARTPDPRINREYAPIYLDGSHGTPERYPVQVQPRSHKGYRQPPRKRQPMGSAPRIRTPGPKTEYPLTYPSNAPGLMRQYAVGGFASIPNAQATETQPQSSSPIHDDSDPSTTPDQSPTFKERLVASLEAAPYAQQSRRSPPMSANSHRPTTPTQGPTLQDRLTKCLEAVEFILNSETLHGILEHPQALRKEAEMIESLKVQLDACKAEANVAEGIARLSSEVLKALTMSFETSEKFGSASVAALNDIRHELTEPERDGRPTIRSMLQSNSARLDRLCDLVVEHPADAVEVLSERITSMGLGEE